ncbi:MAG: hypothetical protein ABIQ27_07300 [Flavobacterium sp.]|uniref:hypothetical protein n=1 Tax=Flavobacterium sp. TaxID=239 RepID=UPI0032630BBC
MKKHIILFLLVFGSALQAQTQDNFIGKWVTNEGNILEIYIQDSSYYGKMDNKVVLIQMIKKSDTQLYGGTFYKDELKTEYEAKLKLIDRNTLRLKVMYGLSSATIIWLRTPLIWKEKTNEITVIQH